MRAIIVAIVLLAMAPAQAEDLYFPADVFDPEVLAHHLEANSYYGDTARITIVMPSSQILIPDVDEPPELEEGLIACVNGKAMFRENGKRRFLDAMASRPFCTL